MSDKQNRNRGYAILRSRLPGEDHEMMLAIGDYLPDSSQGPEILMCLGVYKYFNANCRYCKIEVHSDAVGFLVSCPDLFAGLNEIESDQGSPPSPDQVLSLLNNLGFVDRTGPEPEPMVTLETIQVSEELWGRFTRECERQEITPPAYLAAILEGELSRLGNAPEVN